MTLDEMKALPPEEQKALYNRIKSVRKAYKVTNYCLPMDTQVLTKGGWKNFDGIRVGETLPVYDHLSGKVVDGEVLLRHFYEDTPLVECSNSYSKFVCTPNHKWFSQKRVNSVGAKGWFKYGYTETVDLKTEDNIVLTAPYVGDIRGGITEDEAMLMGLILSDGYYKWSDESSGPSTSFGNRRGVICMIAQSKNNFYKEVEGCLKRLGLGYRKDTVSAENGNDVYKYHLTSQSARDYLTRVVGVGNSKHGHNWTAWVMSLSRDSLESFYEGFYMGDGCKSRRTIDQNEGNVFDAVVAATQLLGEGRTLISGNSKCRSISRGRSNNMTWQKIKVRGVPNQDTFCLTTTGQSFIIRQGDFVGITGNSATYGIGSPKLSRSLGISEKEAKALLEAYWDRNWAVKKLAEDQYVKTLKDGTMWLKNPVSGFYYSLRYEKDRFSTLNQGTGVFCFDTWVMFARKLGVQVVGQFHDEVVVVSDDPNSIQENLQKAIEMTNEKLKLNVPLGIDVQVGKTYGEVH